MKLTHFLLLAVGFVVAGVALFLLAGPGGDPEPADSVDLEAADGRGGPLVDEGQDQIAGLGGAATGSRAAARAGAPPQLATSAGALTVQIAWPPGARPSEALEVVAFSYPLHPITLAGAWLSDPAAIERAEARRSVVDRLKDPRESARAIRAKVAARAFATRAADGSWTAVLQREGPAKRLWIHALGGGFRSTRAIEAPAGAATVELEVVGAASLTVQCQAAGDALDLFGAVVTVSERRSAGSMMSMGSQASTAFHAECDLGPGNSSIFPSIPTGMEFSIRVAGDGFAPTTLDVKELSAMEKRVVTVELTAGANIRGQVVDSRGNPIADAAVTAAVPGVAFGFDDVVIREGVSGPDGAFVLARLEDGPYIVRADATGRLQSKRIQAEVLDNKDLVGLVVTLEEGRSIAGTLRFEDGTPVAGATVLAEFDVSHMAGPAGMASSRGAAGSGVSDKEGGFRIVGLGSGPFTVTASARPGEGAEAPLWRARLDGVSVGPTPIDLVLRPPLSITGRLVDETGARVAGSTILCTRLLNGSMGDVHLEARQVDTDDQGAFECRELEAGTWNLAVATERYVTLDDVVVDVERPVEGITVVAQRTATVRGRVVDPAGAPVDDARVAPVISTPAWQAGLSQRPKPAGTFTAADGTFELVGVPPGRPQLRALSDRHGPVVTDPLDLAPGALFEGLELQLSIGGTIEGIVFDDGGRTAAGRAIIVQQVSLNTMRSAVTADDGTFRAAGLSPGKYQVISIDANSDLSGDTGERGMASLFEAMSMATATVQEGETAYVILGAPPAHPVTVRGRLTMAGEPYADAMVTWLPTSGSVYENMKVSTSDAEGRYELELDDVGDYMVNVASGVGVGGQQVTVEFRTSVPEGSDAVQRDFDLPSGALAGRVLSSDGNPVAGARVTVTSASAIRTDQLFGDSYAEVQTAADGSWEARGLAADSYRVMAGGPVVLTESRRAPARVITEDIALGEGQRIENIEIVLPEPGAIQVLVLSAAGTGLPGAVVFVRDEAGRDTEMFSMNATGDNGKVVVRGLAPGRYTVCARTATEASRESDLLTVEAGATATVSVTLEPGTFLSAELKARKDEQLAAARIRVLDEDGHDVARRISVLDFQQTLSQRSFSPFERRIGPLAPGSYTVIAIAADGRDARRRVTLDGEAERTVTLRLR